MAAPVVTMDPPVQETSTVNAAIRLLDVLGHLPEDHPLLSPLSEAVAVLRLQMSPAERAAVADAYRCWLAQRGAVTPSSPNHA